MRLLVNTTIAALSLVSCTLYNEPTTTINESVATGEHNATETKPLEWRTYLPDGQLNVQGLWTYTLGGLNIEELSNVMETERTAPSMIIEPSDQVLPYHPWARTRRNEVLNNYNHPNHAQVDPQNRGWPDGIPRLNYYTPGPIQILQPPGYVVFLYETQHEFRVVPLDRRPRLDSKIKLWMGDSRGRWEENTLIIDVTNHNDSTRLSVVGDFHSDEMRVIESFTFIDSDTLEYRAKIDDPKTYTKPWVLGVTIKRDTLPGNEIMEYSGVEGEKDANLMVEIPLNAQQ